MALINTSVSNLIQGVSQQPDAIRFAGQCEEQENALPSIVDGLQKRPGCQHIVTLLNAASLDANSKIHFIERDQDERYVVIIKNKTSSTKSIAAFNLSTGQQATITERYTGVVESFTTDYIGKKEITLTQKSPVTVLSSESARLGKLRITGGLNKGTTLYDIHDIATDTDKKRLRFDGDVTLYGSGTGSYQNTVEYTVDNADNAELILETRNYLTHGVDDSTPTVPVDDLKLFTTGDFTYVLNTKKKVTKDSTTSAPVSSDALVFVKQGDYERKYGLSITTAGGTTYENWTYSGSSQKKVSSVYHNTAREAESDFIISNLFEGTLSATSPNELTRVVYDATTTANPRYDQPLNIVRNTSYFGENPVSLASDSSFTVSLKGNQVGVITGPADFTIQVDDSMAGDGLGVAYKSVPNLADLPNTATHRFKIAVQGDVDASEDDRYVQFLINGHTPSLADGSVGDGGWFETSGGNVSDRIDSNTMPLILKSTAVDKFELNHMPLDKLDAGDEVTNPDPSFIGTSIQRVFQFKSRLGFLSGSSVSMSEVKFGGYDGELDLQTIQLLPDFSYIATGRRPNRRHHLV